MFIGHAYKQNTKRGWGFVPNLTVFCLCIHGTVSLQLVYDSRPVTCVRVCLDTIDKIIILCISGTDWYMVDQFL